MPDQSVPDQSVRREKPRRVRGMQDFLPERAAQLARIIKTAETCARLYGFARVETPILEQASLFRHSLGLASDVVMKEMYQFTDKGDDELCLRPEGTAGVVRALINGDLTQKQNLPQRFFYAGPMFRRERPQKGRFRQFHQCGVELLGSSTSSETATWEVIFCAWNFLRRLGIADKTQLRINNLGTQKERSDYVDKLRVHFKKFSSTLSPNSLERLERNPLRILDSKDASDQEAIEQAPFISDPEKICINRDNLNKIGIECKYDKRLVRGLDYYNDFVFEFVETGDERAQSTLLAGGCYDGLSETLGGHPVSAVGWAAGLERLIDLGIYDNRGKSFHQDLKICFLIDSDDRNEIIKISQYFSNLRNNLYHSIASVYPIVLLPTIIGGKKLADNEHATYVVGYPESEVEKFYLRNMVTGEQIDNLSSIGLVKILKDIIETRIEPEGTL